jgi:OOP family OmpA-OmpF porin
MNKLLTAAVAVVLGAASAASFADSGNFFVNGNAGQANWRDDGAARSLSAQPGVTNVNQDNNGLAGALRVGYRWHSVVDYGVELGYAYLGENTVRVSTSDASGNLKQKSRGYLMGGNLNWNITDSWYVSGRAGWYRGRNVLQGRVYSAEGRSAGTLDTYTATGEYMGLGVGYNINPQFSVGLNFDHFRLPASGGEGPSTKVNMSTVGGEFRF